MTASSSPQHGAEHAGRRSTARLLARAPAWPPARRAAGGPSPTAGRRGGRSRRAAWPAWPRSRAGGTTRPAGRPGVRGAAAASHRAAGRGPAHRARGTGATTGGRLARRDALGEDRRQQGGVEVAAGAGPDATRRRAASVTSGWASGTARGGRSKAVMATARSAAQSAPGPHAVASGVPVDQSSCTVAGPSGVQHALVIAVASSLVVGSKRPWRYHASVLATSGVGTRRKVPAATVAAGGSGGVRSECVRGSRRRRSARCRTCRRRRPARRRTGGRAGPRRPRPAAAGAGHRSSCSGTAGDRTARSAPRDRWRPGRSAAGTRRSADLLHRRSTGDGRST